MAVTKIRNEQLKTGIFQVTGGLPSNGANNSYLESWENVGMNVVPVVLPFNANLVALSLSTDGPETWTLEVEVNEVLKSGATLTSTAADNAYSAAYDIEFNAGDKIMFRINTADTLITSPHAEALFKRRYV